MHEKMSQKRVLNDRLRYIFLIFIYFFIDFYFSRNTHALSLTIIGTKSGMFNRSKEIGKIDK